MKKFIYDLQLNIIAVVFLSVLFENTKILFLCFSFLLSWFILRICEKYLLDATYFELYPFNLIKSTKYFLFLLVKIYKSGFTIIPSILTGKADPKFVEIYTELENNVDLVVLSNSITLTPGTITVDLDGHKLLILQMNAAEMTATEAGHHIKGDLEYKIKEGL